MNRDLFTPEEPRRLPDPWPHQERAYREIRNAYRDHNIQMLVSPTGSGKTAIALRFISEALMRTRRALFVCDRLTLIDQTSARADACGLTDHGIVQATHWRRDNSRPFQIASIQTIQARGYWPDADVIIFDEAHTQYQATKDKLLSLKGSRVAVIGLTATPCTQGLGQYYSHVVNAATMDELTRAGVLVPMHVLTCVHPDMKGAATASGEWTARGASERELTILGDVVAEWQNHGEGRKTIAFGADIAYCTELVQRFNAVGVGAAAFTSETKSAEREALLSEFTKPDSAIRVLVSVEALAKGFDVKDIGCLIDARPLRKSLSTFIQMIGRGLRSSKETGKSDLIVLDHSGNFQRFYDDFVDVYYNGFGELGSAEKKDSVVRKDDEPFDMAGCPQCHHKPFRRRCLACGYEKPTQSLADESPGVMREIRIGKKVAAASQEDLWNQLCTHARNSTIQKKYGWCWHKFQEITGQQAPKSFSFERAPDVPITAATLGKLRQLQIRYRYRRAREEQHAVA